MKIKVSELLATIEILTEHLKSSSCKEIELSDDYYWFVPKTERYDVYKQPKELTIGQLSFDWEELSNIRKGKSDPVNYAFVWLAMLLLKIGEDLPDIEIDQTN
jgi:hypothetical protein